MSKKLETTQSFSPIREIRNGIVATKNGDFVKILEFSPINFFLRSGEEQDAIVDSFKGALRIMPDLVHFKIVSREADVNNFIDGLNRDMAAEPNEKCRALQAEQIDLINTVSKMQGVSRHFYLSFAYSLKEGFERRPSFEQICRELDMKGNEIALAMNRCGNEKLSVDQDDNYTKSVIHSILSRAESAEYSYSDRDKEIRSKYMEQYNLRQKWVYPVNDFLAPMEIDSRLSPNYMVVDGLYYSYLYVPSGAYPLRAYSGWLQSLIDIDEGIDIDFWVQKLPIDKIQGKLKYSLRYNKMRAKETDDTATDYDDLHAAIDSGYYIKQSLSQGDTFCYMSTVLTVTAPTRNSLITRVNGVKNIALQCGLEYTLMFSQTATTAGTKNRTPVATTIQYIGTAILNDLQFNAPNQDLSTASAKFTGSTDLHRA